MKRVKTVITLTIESDAKLFNSKEFQEFIGEVQNGNMQKEMMGDLRKRNPDAQFKVTATVWTNYKQVNKC